MALCIKINYQNLQSTNLYFCLYSLSMRKTRNGVTTKIVTYIAILFQKNDVAGIVEILCTRYSAAIASVKKAYETGILCNLLTSYSKPVTCITFLSYISITMEHNSSAVECPTRVRV